MQFAMQEVELQHVSVLLDILVIPILLVDQSVPSILNVLPTKPVEIRNVLILVISLQFIIGIANLLLHLPIVLATLHNLGAALLVVILVGINSRITKPWQN